MFLRIPIDFGWPMLWPPIHLPTEDNCSREAKTLFSCLERTPFRWPRLWQPINASAVVSSFKALQCSRLPELSEFKERLNPQFSVEILSSQVLDFLDSHKQHLSQVREVLFISQDLSVVAPQIFRYFPSVEKAIFLYNSFQRLPKELGSLKKLTSLDILNTRLNDVIAICHLTGLQHLSMNHNNLRELPNEMGNLSNLKSLSCKGNNLSSLPKTFKRLKHLERLELNDNLFEFVPPVIFQLPSLKVINLTSNPLLHVVSGREPQSPGYRWIRLPYNPPNWAPEALIIYTPSDNTRLTQSANI